MGRILLIQHRRRSPAPAPASSPSRAHSGSASRAAQACRAVWKWVRTACSWADLLDPNPRAAGSALRRPRRARTRGCRGVVRPARTARSSLSTGCARGPRAGPGCRTDGWAEPGPANLAVLVDLFAGTCTCRAELRLHSPDREALAPEEGLLCRATRLVGGHLKTSQCGTGQARSAAVASKTSRRVFSSRGRSRVGQAAAPASRSALGYASMSQKVPQRDPYGRYGPPKPMGRLAEDWVFPRLAVGHPSRLEPRGRLCRLALSAALSAATSAPASASADPESGRITFQGRGACPSEQEFLADVASHTARARHPRGNETRTFSVTVTDEESASVGRVEIRDAHGAVVTREVRGETCVEVASALALIVALALDPRTPLLPER